MDNSLKPYMIRAIYEWCVDNNQSPHITVMDEDGAIPASCIKDGFFTLNISPAAAQELKIGNKHIEMFVRFDGVGQAVKIRVARVTAIYSAESPGVGFMFMPEAAIEPEPEVKEEKTARPGHLRLVKSD